MSFEKAPMYKSILIPTDGSATAEKAVIAGTDYARESGAKIVFFTALPEYEMPSEAELLARHKVQSIFEYEKQAETTARAILDKAAASAKDANIAFETDYALADLPYKAIIDAAKKHGCDAIFMASHARTGLPALWYGSQTHDVLTHSDIPTLVYR
jgi:nucleotide-binding universal stress UspA family protein